MKIFKYLLSLLILVTTTYTLVIPKFNSSYLKTIGNNADIITAEHQEGDYLYAEQWNDKFLAIKNHIVENFGYIPSDTYTEIYLTSGEIIDADLINNKFQSYVNSLKEIDPNVTTPSQLNISNNFSDTGKIKHSEINSKFIALKAMIDSTTSLPDLIVNAGQTVNINANTINEHRDVIINGTLNINGEGAILFRARRNFTLNGTINGSANNATVGDSISYESQTYTDTKAQQSAGLSSGRPNGANGKHGTPVVIYAKNLTGNGSINLSGSNGGTGSSATSTRRCNSGYRVVNIASNCGTGTRYTCMTNSYSPGNSCNSSSSCFPSTNVCNTLYAFDLKNKFNNIIKELKFKTVKAGGINICIGNTCPDSYFHKPFFTQDGNRGGGGAGGNGGNLFKKISNDSSNFSINLNRGNGGALNSYGTGGTVGSHGLNGTIINLSYE